MDQLFIFPFNGNGLEALDCIQGKFEFMGFIDDTKEKQGANRYGFNVYGREILKNYPKAKLLAVPGSPASYKVRDKIINDFNSDIERFVTLIHPKASVSPLASIGKNVLIMAGVVITSNAVIEDHVCILPNSVVHHDSVIKKYSLIGANVSVAGSVEIGEHCYIGSGTRIINGISIGAGSLLGLGSNVIRPVPANSKMAGNPARAL